MKYCVSGRQAMSILHNADEIKVRYEDRERIIDFITAGFTDKTIIVEIPKDIMSIDWHLLDAYNNDLNLVLCLYNLAHIDECIQHKVKYYWAYPITSYYELRGLIALKPYYLHLGMPLCFDLANIKKITDIPIRLTANVAYDAYIPREDGVCGQWIRPEDVTHYDTYVEALEFANVDLTAEKTLLHIYKDNKEWPGDLNILIKNLNYNIDNRALPDEIGTIRLTCGQRCMFNGCCSYCKQAFNFAQHICDEYNRQKALKDDN